MISVDFLAKYRLSWSNSVSLEPELSPAEVTGGTTHRQGRGNSRRVYAKQAALKTLGEQATGTQRKQNPPEEKETLDTWVSETL